MTDKKLSNPYVNTPTQLTKQIRNLAKDVDELRGKLNLMESDVKLVYQHYYEMKVEVEILQDAMEKIDPTPKLFAWGITMVVSLLLGTVICYGVLDFMDKIAEHTPQ